MIDVTPYIEKLDRLGEYINLCLEYDISVWRVARVDKYEETFPEPKKIHDSEGNLQMTVFGVSVSFPIPEKIPFEEWLETKNKEQ